MKKFCLLCVAAILSLNLCAQNYFCIVNEGTYITTRPNAKLQPLSISKTDNIRGWSGTDSEKKRQAKCRPILLKQSEHLLVGKFGEDYDSKQKLKPKSYIVQYKKCWYVIEQEDVWDNNLLNICNATINSYYTNIDIKYTTKTDEVRSMTEQKNLLLHNLDLYIKEYQDSVLFYTNTQKQWHIVRDSISKIAREQAKQQEKIITRQNQIVLERWHASLPKNRPIEITHAKLCSPNTAGGCDYEFYYKNLSAKTIKYLHIYGITYNAVNDPVACEIRKDIEFCGKITGPIYPGDNYAGIWHNIIYNNSANYLKINSIKIIYMDNTSITLSSRSIKNLFAPNPPQLAMIPKPEDIISDTLKDFASKNKWVFSDTYYNNRIELWNYRISVIHKIKKELTENRPIEQGSRLQVQNDNRIQEVVTKVNSLIANQKKVEEYISTMKNTYPHLRYL